MDLVILIKFLDYNPNYLLQKACKQYKVLSAYGQLVTFVLQT